MGATFSCFIPGCISDMPTTIASLRKALKHRRQALSRDQLDLHSEIVVTRLKDYFSDHDSKRIALYHAFNGEVDLSDLWPALLNMGHQVFLPVINQQTQTMTFNAWQETTVLSASSYGILEPESSPAILATELDFVLMPLLAFDQNGRRLGMGGGFYDRCFAFKLKPGRNQPLLIGVAHQFQRVACLNAQSWDVPLDAVVSEQAFINFKRDT